MNTCNHVLISAENIPQATVILDALLEKKLIFGGPIISGPAKFWWKGEICAMDYSYILTYALAGTKSKLTTAAEAASVEEVCMISFTPPFG